MRYLPLILCTNDSTVGYMNQMIPQPLQDAVVQATDKYLHIAEQQYARKFNVKGIYYDVNTPYVIGRCESTYRSYTSLEAAYSIIRINPAYLLMYEYDYIDTVIPHEVAHLVAAHMQAISDSHDDGGHNELWCEVMNVFERKPDVLIDGYILCSTLKFKLLYFYKNRCKKFLWG